MFFFQFIAIGPILVLFLVLVIVLVLFLVLVLLPIYYFIGSSLVLQTPQKLLPRKSASPAGSSGHDALLLERLFQLNPQLLKGEALKQGSSEVLISDESARWLTFLLAKLAVDPLREQLNARSEDIGKLLQSRIMEKISGK